MIIKLLESLNLFKYFHKRVYNRLFPYYGQFYVYKVHTRLLNMYFVPYIFKCILNGEICIL